MTVLMYSLTYDLWAMTSDLFDSEPITAVDGHIHVVVPGRDPVMSVGAQHAALHQEVGHVEQLWTINKN